MPPSRRKVIATFSGLLAGGGALSAGYSSTSGFPTVLGQKAVSNTLDIGDLPKETTFTLEPTDFQTYNLALDEQADLSIDALVRWGSELDLLTFPSETEYRAYVDGYRARYVEGLSAFGQLEFDDLSETVDSGEYYITVDNTDWQGEFPNVISDRQAEQNAGLSKDETANDPDERSNATGDPSLENEQGGITVMGSGENRANIYLSISGSST